MTGIIVCLLVFLVAVYLLKLGSMYVIERRRPDWAVEREQLRQDLKRSYCVARWMTRRMLRR